MDIFITLLVFIIITCIALYITVIIRGGNTHTFIGGAKKPGVHTHKIKNYKNLVAHIAGPSGSGKTTMADNLRSKYLNVIFFDLDILINDIIDASGDVFKYGTYEERANIIHERYPKAIESFLKEAKHPVVFVGFEGRFECDVELPTKNKFVIDKFVSDIVRQKYNRDNETMEDVYNHIDSILGNYNYYDEHGYKFITTSEPVEALLKKYI